MDGFDIKNFSKIDDKFVEEVNKELSNPKTFERLHGYLRDLLNAPEEWNFYHFPLVIQPHPCLAEFDVEAIGSSSEGLSLTEYSEAGFNEELDLTLVLKTLKVSESPNNYFKENFAQMIYSDTFPGHVSVKIHESATAEFWSSLCNVVTDRHGTVNEFFIAPEGITDEFYLMMSYRHSIENMAKFRKHLDMENLSCILDAGKNVFDDDDIEFLRDTASGKLENSSDSEVYYTMYCQEGPAFKTTLFFKENKSSLQYDCAVAIRCVDWPSAASEWVHRKRNQEWPTQQLVNEITKEGCLIVPKIPTNSKTRLEWRLSFCLAERKLMRSLEKQQRLCYIFLKGIWRKFLKPPAGKGLQSYHLKNVLLWECEAVPADNWSCDTLTERVFGLLFRLKGFIEKGSCPHYILPENNLFADIDKDVLYRAGERVGTCIDQANVVWIENTALFLLSPEKTRLGMKAEMLVLYIDLIEKLSRKFLSFVTEKVPNFLDLKKIDDKKDASLVESLEQIIGKHRASMVIEVINKATKPNVGSLMRRYMCSRGSPKQLFVQGREGFLDFVCSTVSAMTAWTELTELVTQLEILKSQNFTEFGFSSQFAQNEAVKLLAQFVGEWTLNNGDILGENSMYMLLSEAIDFENGDYSFDISDEEDSIVSVEVFDCDKCDKEIEGDRYHCSECQDYDLCEACFQTNNDHSHEFVKIEADIIYSRT